jgi:two-component system LytT family response regulator
MSEPIHCIIVDDEPIARDILNEHLGKIDRIRVVASCKNALEAFQAINDYPVDLVFLDINMPEIDGLAFARSMTQQIKVIFTTAYREYAVDGFDLRAVDYLLKPVSFERLLQSINKFLDESRIADHNNHREITSEQDDSIYVRSDRKMIRIRFSEIRYLESIGDYIKIHLHDRTVVTRETMTTLEAKLPAGEFIRVHRSFLAARKAIDSFTAEYVEIGGIQLPVSRGYRDDVVASLQRADR